MKINELLLESTPFAYMKELQAKFKEAAASAGMVWSAGMGWPQVVKDGFWFGGGLKPTGRGNKDAIIRPGDLPAAAVQKYVLKTVADVLEDAMKNGQTVKVANADRKASVRDVKPGEAFEALSKAIKVMKPPGAYAGDPHLPSVTWYISKPANMSDAETIRLDVSLHTPYVDPRGKSKEQAANIEQNSHAVFMTSLPKATVKALMLWFHGRQVWKDGNKVTKHPSWKDDNNEHSEYEYKDGESWRIRHRPMSKEYKAFNDRVLALCLKHGVRVPKKLDGIWTSLTAKVGTKGAITIPPDEFLALFKEFPGA